MRYNIDIKDRTLDAIIDSLSLIKKGRSKTMMIRVKNANGDSIELSPNTKSALDSLGLEADKTGADWNETTKKMLRVLGDDNFDITKLTSEVSFIDTKEGKKILEIVINYAGM